jgi:hypothetical protein
MGAEHLMFAKETVFGTWVAATTALPVESVSLGGEMPLIENRDTGGGKAARAPRAGAVAVTGEIATHIYGKTLPALLKGVYGTKAKTADGTGFINKLLPNDDTAHESFSMQKRYSAAVAESFKGVRIAGYKVEASAGELAKLTVRTEGQDFGVPGGTWTDGTSAPAVQSPSYAAGQTDPMVFYEGSIQIGGTIALTSGEIVVTGGTQRHAIDNISFDIDYGLITDDYEVYKDSRVRNSIDDGARTIEIGFEPNWATVGTEFLLAWKTQATAVIELIFTSANTYDTAKPYVYKWTFPSVRYSAAAAPELSSEYALKRTSVAGQAFYNSTATSDHGLVIKCDADLTL